MEEEFAEQSEKWIKSREHRIRNFVRLTAYIFIGSGLIWLFIWAAAGLWFFFGMVVMVELAALLVLWYIRKNKTLEASYLMIAAAATHFTVICLITSGTSSNNFTTHYWYIVMALGSYFLLADGKFWAREILPVFFLLLTFLFHFRFIPGFSLVMISNEMHKVISMIDMISALTLILVFTRLFVSEIQKQSAEQLKMEKIERQYEILKNQVNPHFLFNSFNSLVTVIEDSPDKAVEYVMRLSDFFRNLLTFREKNLISLRKELTLVSDYIFLQQKRYGANFKVSVEIDEQLLDTVIVPPMGIQILVENCLKHNAVSRETPLLVSIYGEGDQYIVIRNNINERSVKEPSTGVGLYNLRSRYSMVGEREVLVESGDNVFTVKLPIIYAGQNAGSAG